MYRLILAVTALAMFTSDPAFAQITRSTGVPLGSPPIVSEFTMVDDLRHDNVGTQARSGSNTPYSSEVVVPEGAWVTQIEIGEQNDRPCRVRLRWSTIDNGTLSNGSELSGDCNNSSRSWEGVGANAFVPEGDYADQQLRVIRGLRVCQRNSNDRVKGLEIQAGSINNLVPQYAGLRDVDMNEGLRRFQRANCNDWENNFVTCPGQQVLIGLEVFSERGIKGMAPICARLRVTR